MSESNPEQSGRADLEDLEDVDEADGRDDPAAEVDPAAEGAETDDEAAAARTVEHELEEEAAVADRLMDELEELRDRHLRLAAEFENYRKRTRQELLKTRELGRADLAGRLLEPLDDLRRIGDFSEESATFEALHEGVALVERKLMKQLREAGLEPIEAQGERFDPNEHEALSSVPTDDPDEDQTVAEVFEPGYRFGDRLLRPARVVVRTYQPEAGAGESDAGSAAADEGA